MRTISVTLTIFILSTILLISGAASVDYPKMNDDPPLTSEGSQDLILPSQDTTLALSTYFGGTDAEEDMSADLDSEGNLVLFGKTKSDDLPTTTGAYQTTYAGGGDVFVAKFSPEGSLLFCTYLGGSAIEHADYLFVDSEDNILVAGRTDSTDFPMSDAIKDTYSGGGDGYITKLSPDGSSVMFSTFVGGSSEDWVHVVRADSNGDYVFCGHTASLGLGIGSVLQPELANGREGFVAKISRDGQSLDFFTYFGGTNNDFTYVLDLDSNDNIIISGVAYSEDLPLQDPVQDTHAGGLDMYVAKLDRNASTLLFSTYLGGSSSDRPAGLVVDQDDVVIIVGDTNSVDFPVENALQPTYGGNRDALFAKFTGSQLTYASYLGGSEPDRGWDVLVEEGGNFTLVGHTSSTDFPVVDGAIQPDSEGERDMFVSKIAQDGQAVISSTYIGGNGADYGETALVDQEDAYFIIGTTESGDLTTGSSAYQDINAGESDVFIYHGPLIQSGTTSLGIFNIRYLALIGGIALTLVLAVVVVVRTREK